MNNHVIGLWIIDNTGLPLLNRMYTSSEASLIDSALFSGFITAIVAFSKQIVNDTIENLEMGGHNIHYLSFNQFSVVTTTTRESTDIASLQKKMVEIGKKFQQTYKKELEGIERNTITFTDFELVVDELLGQKETGKRKSLNDFEIGLILTEVRFKKITPQEAISRIYRSFQRLDKKSQNFIKEAMKDFETFFTEKTGLSDEEIKMYKEIVGQMTSIMKSEKFFKSF